MIGGAWEKIASFTSPLRDVPADEHRAIEDARVRFNQRRVVVLAGFMAVNHLLSFLYFSSLSRVDPREILWRDHLRVIHATWFVMAVAFALVARRTAPSARLGAVFVLVYSIYGAVVSGNSQIVGRNVDVFLVAFIGVAFAFRLRAMTATIISAVALALLLLLVFTLQESGQGRASALANAVPVAIVTWAVSRMQLVTFVREVRQTRLIERQRDELGRLNGVLDRQLRDKLVERSRELATAIDNAGRARTPMRLDPGTELGGRFVVDDVIGEGGMGTVYRARDRVLGRAVAIKMLSSAPSSGAVKRFLREVEVMADIAHPAIVRALHVDVTSDGQLFHVQELVLGEALDAVARRLGDLAPSHVARIGATIADALAVAHARGVVHRDVKPGNIMLVATAPGAKLLDFGISKLVFLVEGADTTRAGAIVGTPAFMAPEQATASGETREPADVYALGATMRALLGELDDAPEPLRAALVACLDVDAASRPSASRVAEALSAVADALGAEALETINRGLLATSTGPREVTGITWVDGAENEAAS